ncbi:Transcriptional repressor NrdR like [Melia azedarach]|uniref:Transcriptional repressor NrdR like n=1 Tax=Melia azedarach TaxID=155640 RepID=A0ACC1XGK6_MELAZ|nr:Transcriptional repressor NrdR like [Melia azedarach]
MAILSLAYYESLKRYWRRRKYQRINGVKRKKLRILRLGGGGSPRRIWRIRRRNPKQHLKLISPIKLLEKFHEAYVGMMIAVAKKMANPNSNNGGKKVAKDRQVSLVSSGEEVDSKMVVEIYKKLAASRQLRTEEL